MTNKAGTTTTASTITESGDNAEIIISENGYYSTSSKISVPIETIKNEVDSLNKQLVLPSFSAGDELESSVSGTYNYSGYFSINTSNFGFTNLTIESVIGNSNAWLNVSSYDKNETSVFNYKYTNGTNISIDISSAFKVVLSVRGKTINGNIRYSVTARNLIFS